MTNTFINEKTGLFKSECKIINLKYEYEGYTGKEKWAIITTLSEEEMIRKYADIMGSYVPYVFLSEAQGAAIVEYQNNEAKHRMRILRYGHAFDINDGTFEEHHLELAFYEDILEKIEREEENARIKQAINTLTEIQKRRIVKYFFGQKNYREIAKEEGVNISKIEKSIKIALEKLKNILV